MDKDNRDFADGRGGFASDGAWQFALRELQRVLSRPGFWIGFVAIVAILVATGPAGTLDAYSVAERLAYWSGVALLTFATGLFATILFHRLIGRVIGTRVIALAISATAAALPITAEVWVIGNVFADRAPFDPSGLPGLFGMCLVITLALTVLFDRAPLDPPAQTVMEEPYSPSLPPFFKRLKKSLGRELISLQAQDHYVEVTTKAGKDLILIRLADAEAELAGYPGMRVHRSWWVARDAVEDMRNENGRPVLALTNGTVVPVSREKRADVRNWVDAAPA